MSDNQSLFYVLVALAVVGCGMCFIALSIVIRCVEIRREDKRLSAAIDSYDLSVGEALMVLMDDDLYKGYTEDQI